MAKELAPAGDEPATAVEPTAVSVSAAAVESGYDIVRFRNRAMVLVRTPYPHYTPLHREMFDRIAYPILGGVSRSRMNDTFSFLCNTAEDRSHLEHHVLFGVPLSKTVVEADTDLIHAVNNKPVVWDTRELAPRYDIEPGDCIWRSPYSPRRVPDPDKAERLGFILSLAGGDEGLYDDIMQSLAPMVMARKPDGVIWWVGDGANGKSTLMDALYKIFPGQLSSINVKRLSDGRDTPSLNGTLANIVKESSEGRIDDTEVYKSIGTHENFRVHKFHSQDDIEIRGNLHHIFSANTIPTFNDKGFSARRRTFIIPFTQRFESDPTFEERTFTADFFGQLIAEMCRYARRLADQGYKYKWSAKTLAAKANYDAEAGNADDYAAQLVREGVVAFDSFLPVKQDYDNWCAEQGFVPLGLGNLRRSLQGVGFERLSFREDEGGVRKHYRLPQFLTDDLMQFNIGRPGLYTTVGFKPEKAAPPPTTDTPAAKAKQESIIGDKW